jgi:hypothetical protein
MTSKSFCDRCGQECRAMITITVYDKENKNAHADLCNACLVWLFEQLDKFLKLDKWFK